VFSFFEVVYFKELHNYYVKIIAPANDIIKSMITVIIAGGSGTRLWPLSTSDYPKHLLKLTGERTLLQSAFDRASEAGETVYVVTEASHAHHVKEQLPELPEDNFLIEPGRRGTGNCIVFALDIIGRRHDKDEPIAFVHSDHSIRDVEGYVKSLHIAADASNKTNKVTLIGIEPTFPSTGFGYIERDGELADTGAYNIESFKEKPDYETAQSYVRAGNYLWNCGYFVGSVNTFLSEIKAVAPDLQESFDKLSSLDQPLGEEYNETYLSFPDLVIDYSLAERSSNLAVVPANFDWMDIGSFKDLHEANESDENGNFFKGNAIYDIELENVYIQNEEAKPVVTIGLDNIVVINTPDGILVARKDLSQKVKDAVGRIKEDQAK
jgi:mannose-1-phosphate guanylyltransferase/mannose-6-phosphate isomerase